VRSDEDSLSESHSEYVGSASDTDTSELDPGIKNQKSKKKQTGKHVTTPPASKKSVNTPKAAIAGKGDGGGESADTPTTKKRRNMRKSVEDCKFMQAHNELLKPLYAHYQVQTACTLGLKLCGLIQELLKLCGPKKEKLKSSVLLF